MAMWSDGKLLKKDIESKEPKTVPVREMTWDEIIGEGILCYFWNDDFEDRKFGEVNRATRFPNSYILEFDGGSWREFKNCKPIDSAIVVVEPKKPEKKYRPFKTFNEVIEAIEVHGQWIVNKNKDYYLFVHCLNFQNEKQMNETFKGYQFLDGTPFGVLEEIK